MSRTLIITIVLLLAAGLEVNAQKRAGHAAIKVDSVATDSAEYRLVVLDPGFDAWLINKPPLTYHSNDFYRIQNELFVTEWNIRYNDPLRYGHLYDNRIDYNPRIAYGIEFNYRLYYYFLFFQEQTGVRLSGTGK